MHGIRSIPTMGGMSHRTDPPRQLSDPASAVVRSLPVLSAVSLSKRYGDVAALDDVSISLLAGTSTAVIGPSGSGKSTLLHCLAGFARPDSGEVLLDGRRIDALSEGAATRLRREQFGFVFQSDQLLAELPAVENVALPLMLGGMSRGAAVAEAARWFAPLELDGLQDRRPGQLSGGQTQRVAIARAMVVRPAVVVADEPTAALDRATGAATISVLTSACQAAGTALLVVTHDPEIAARCHRTISMRDGRITGIDDRHAAPSTTTAPVVAGAPIGPVR